MSTLLPRSARGNTSHVYTLTNSFGNHSTTDAALKIATLPLLNATASRTHFGRLQSPCGYSHISAQRRAASYISRPKRPYTFTQLVTLSDGSTYLHRTSSPAPVHRSIKDQRNTPLWNPSSSRLRIVEADASGRLRAFRARFGRGWDATNGKAPEVQREAEEGEREGERMLRGGNESDEGPSVAAATSSQESDDSLLDLISGFQRDEAVERGMQSKKVRKSGGPAGGKKK